MNARFLQQSAISLARWRRYRRTRTPKPIRVSQQAVEFMRSGLESSEPLMPDGDPIDILLPLGPGSCRNDLEVRYALRGIEQFAEGWRRVVIVGRCPEFLNPDDKLVMVPREEFSGNHESRICQKLAWTMGTQDVTPHCALWNDDYVLQKPTDIRRVPFYHNGPLKEFASRRSMDRYRRAMELTSAYLEMAGKPSMNYDIHVPMIYQRDRFLRLERWWEASRQSTSGLVTKSVYANVHLDSEGKRYQDCKLNRLNNGWESRIADRWLFSYGDMAIQTGLVEWLEQHFQKPSRWEK